MNTQISSSQSSFNEKGRANTVFRYVVLVMQTFFGAWYLLHGVNHFYHVFPQPSGSESLTSQLISVLIKSGMFDFIKASEIVAGLMMLSHRFVPLSIVIAIPSAFVIAYSNIFMQSDLQSLFVGITIFVILGTMSIGYLDSFLPMLRYKAGAPTARTLVEVLGQVRGDAGQQ